MTGRRTVSALVCLAFVCLAGVARAQEENPAAQARVKLGPLALNPVISVRDGGIDTNVFNDATNPKSDFTITIAPVTDAWLRMGRTWLTGTVTEDVIWYQKYRSERSANNTYKLGWLVPLNRVRFEVNGSWTNTRDRVGFEIDARAPRWEKSFGGTASIRALSKTFIGVQASRAYTQYDLNAEFLGINLHDQLSRVVTNMGVVANTKLTPLTTLNFSAMRSQDRFKYEPLRNSNSTAYSATVQFDPFALLKGTATFGYTEFKPLSPDLAPYLGLTSKVDLSYVLLMVTRMSVQYNREVKYSYDVNQPYYLEHGIGGSVTQQIFGPLDVVVRGATRDLRYFDRADAVIEVPNRTDHVVGFGGGTGYHLGKDLRIGFNIDQTERRSLIASRRYKGLKYGFSVTYGQ